LRNITLVGFMGTGKTTVGRILAHRLGYRFVDVDNEVEREQGVTISHIFSEFGEPHFRQLEHDMIKRLSDSKGLVISAGGGAVINPENTENMKAGGPVVCLAAGPDVILGRVEGSTHRPLLQVPDPRGRIQELLNARAPFYARADVTIDTDGLAPEDVADRVMEAVDGLKNNAR
jgi:shikimate kinase